MERNLILDRNPQVSRILLQGGGELVVKESETSQRRIIELHETAHNILLIGGEYRMKDAKNLPILFPKVNNTI